MAEMWETKITRIKPNEIRVRGYRIDALMENTSFSETIFLLFTGELPEPKVAKLLEAIFVSSIDHGVTPPSVQAARVATSTGAPLNAAAAAGILSINDFHGGAIDNCMGVLAEVVKAVNLETRALDQVADLLVDDYLKSKKRMPGFGHRIHTNDPRTDKLFSLAEDAGVSGQGVKMIHSIAKAFECRGKNLPINVDGAIAAVLIDLKIPRELANAFFMIARLPGLCIHAYEEKTTQHPMRNIQISYHTYAGPADRDLPEREES